MNPSLKEKIRKRRTSAERKLFKSYPYAQKFLTAGTLAGALLLTSPKTITPHIPALPANIVEALTETGIALPEKPQEFLKDQLGKILPTLVCPLSSEQEETIASLYEKLTGIRVRATLEGEKLNTCFGLIGAEQHLPRFPGDTVAQHDEFQESGITPGRGAWGYFTQSKAYLDESSILQEKYYVAVQTLYLPDWNKRFSYLRDWYRYRKVLVLNPENGQAVVAVIADAGPANWTGKQFGGSPEVMYHLDLHQGMRKGPVLLFFVDDSENKVPLGPVDYNKINLPRIPIAQKNV